MRLLGYVVMRTLYHLGPIPIRPFFGNFPVRGIQLIIVTLFRYLHNTIVSTVKGENFGRQWVNLTLGTTIYFKIRG